MPTNSRPAAGAALSLLALVGCGSSGGEDEGAATTTSAAAAGVLVTADSDLGEILVDADGRTVYVFDRDTADSGTSACVDACLVNWPAVTASTDEPEAAVVTGDLGTIERDDGTRQVTLNGLPLYTYAGDSDPGDVAGQGVQGIWWVVSPDDDKLTGAATSSSSEPPPVPGY